MIEEYLISEGYADDYKSAIKIVEAMSDAWYELICEKLEPKPWRDGPSQKAVTKQSRIRQKQLNTRDPEQVQKLAIRYAKMTEIIKDKNKENPVAQTLGMSGIRSSQTGGVPQATKKQKEGFTSVSTVNPREQERLAQKAGDLTGQSAEHTPNGIRLRSLAVRTRATRDVNRTSRNLGTTTTQPGGTLPKL